VVESPLLGPKGNKEFFICLRKEDHPDGQGQRAQTS
jgi:hypothetical protein